MVQHVVRSIVPSVNDNGFSRDETEEQQPTHADAAQSPIRPIKRLRRRVVAAVAAAWFVAPVPPVPRSR